MHLRSEFQPELANKGGWLTVFFIFATLAFLAYLRGAAASVVSGGAGGLASLVLAFAILVALIGLLRRKRWAYYLFLMIGAFVLVLQGFVMFSAPEQVFYTDWKFDLPIIFEWLLALGWSGYFLRSRRVYSVIFGTGLAG
ncbi:MAG: hypothetical protein CL799_11065 [Chromatiales bacterium]|jgi:hypothetical protein|nr:hypothetical protein [Chromatiales bacterium]MDP6150060.1 hypothetical protein [Gammaproteobacteria bacterium]MDP7094133.1 hypothetical protein [Gammaproteobacteria bacterium]MDP7271722.1 hypothetical protein [Gammaproteobacteria bacterium]HJP03597.1 hypothetical protein [Gammaproteobacteria bacterium]